MVIGEDPPDRLDKALVAFVPEEAALSRSRLMKMIAAGDVAREGVAITDPKTRVTEGEVYHLTIDHVVELDTQPEGYQSGSWGPPCGKAMLARDGFVWRRP